MIQNRILMTLIIVISFTLGYLLIIYSNNPTPKEELITYKSNSLPLSFSFPAEYKNKLNIDEKDNVIYIMHNIILNDSEFQGLSSLTKFYAQALNKNGEWIIDDLDFNLRIIDKDIFTIHPYGTTGETYKWEDLVQESIFSHSLKNTVYQVQKAVEGEGVIEYYIPKNNKTVLLVVQSEKYFLRSDQEFNSIDGAISSLEGGKILASILNTISILGN